jgi:tRNA ligase
MQKYATEEQLASELWQNNWTAIAEVSRWTISLLSSSFIRSSSQLCDDSFEEHVLGYPPDRTGLHLHGLNESTKAFRTLPQADVDAFANKWGFIRTQSVIFESVHEVKVFTEVVSETGTWNGEAVEGFVVRTHVAERAVDRSVDQYTVPPYPPGSTLFFKVKFDEPYMMYRDWREITKQLLLSGGLGKSKLSASRMKRPETRLYVKWVIDEISKNRQQFEDYTKGKGIISTRDRFLEWAESREGREELAKHKSGVDIRDQNEVGKVFGKTIIVPVAVPGCGASFSADISTDG